MYQKERFEDGISIREISIAGVISIISGGCYVVQAISGFDPCAWAIQSLWSGMQAPPTGTYQVSREWISGRVPGCQPMYSQACVCGYWKYTHKRIG